MSYATFFDFKLNGNPVRIDGLSPHRTLLDHIRSLGLTGTKEGCAEGECGSCAVQFLKEGPDGTRYWPVNSCLITLPMVAGLEVLTIEGLAVDGRLCEAQSVMASCGGSQCGYCTPGFIISMFAEQYRRGRHSADVGALAGNLCRCTGYRPIRDALLSLGVPPAGPHLARLEQPAPTPSVIRYGAPTGRFTRPATLADCFDILAEDPQARLVAGNTDLGVGANLEGERHAHLVAIGDLAELRTFRDEPGGVEIGCGLALSEIRGHWTDAPPVIDEWLQLFASPLIRNRATLGGNLATASPVGDAAPLLLALDAEITIGSRTGCRTVPLAAFFTGRRQTILKPGEVLISVRIAKPLPDRVHFYKVAKRLYNDISTVAAGISIWRDSDGLIARACVAFGGVAATPVRARAAEAELVGRPGDAADFVRARRLAVECLAPISDHRGSAAYRSAVAGNLLVKFHLEGTVP